MSVPWEVLREAYLVVRSSAEPELVEGRPVQGQAVGESRPLGETAVDRNIFIVINITISPVLLSNGKKFKI